MTWVTVVQVLVLGAGLVTLGAIALIFKEAILMATRDRRRKEGDDT